MATRAVREPPVWAGRQSKPWIPAFAGMTAKGQPRRPFDPAGNNIETAARISPPPRAAPESRHSGEGRNPEPGRAAANGRSRPIHARVPSPTARDRSRSVPTERSRVGGPGIWREGQPQGVVPTIRAAPSPGPQTGRMNAWEAPLGAHLRTGGGFLRRGRIYASRAAFHQWQRGRGGNARPRHSRGGQMRLPTRGEPGG